MLPTPSWSAVIWSQQPTAVYLLNHPNNASIFSQKNFELKLLISQMNADQIGQA